MKAQKKRVVFYPLNKTILFQITSFKNEDEEIVY